MDERQENQSAEPGVTGSKILVIDDESISRRIMQNALEASGFTCVRSASSGEEGLESIDRDPPDLVLLDIVMPGIEGYEVCRVIRSRQDTSDVPVLMVTGGDADSEQSLEQSFEAGATDFIAKPIRPVEFLARVRAALAVKTSRDRLKMELARRIQAEKEKQQTIEELEKALAEIRTLSGLLPICSSCKKVRDDDGYWTQIESYVSQRSTAKFSHSICPDCRRTYMQRLKSENEIK